MNVGGRPRLEFDVEEFEKLCELQCTAEEIASFFRFSVDTLDRRIKEHYDGQGFAEVFAQKRGLGRISLRRKQWKLAETNAAVAIFLGKNYLGQKDSHEVTSTAPIVLKYSLNDKKEDTES
jgi:hypothetical protein